MNAFQAWLNTAIAAVTPIVILWKLAQSQVEAMRAAASAEAAALAAATHAEAAVVAVAGMSSDIREIATNTNSIVAAALAAKDESAKAQVSEATAAGIATGIAQGKENT